MRVMLKEGMIVADGPVHEVFTPELLSDVYGIKVVVYRPGNACANSASGD